MDFAPSLTLCQPYQRGYSSRTWTLGILGASLLSAFSAHAQHTIPYTVLVPAFAVDAAELTPVAERLRDTTVIRLGSDDRWRVMPVELRDRPRDPATGRAEAVHYFLVGHVALAGTDTIVARWQLVSVESGATIARNTVRMARRNLDSLVAAFARTVQIDRTLGPCDATAPVCALLREFITAFNARDFEAFRRTFSDDISFFVDRPYPPRRLDGRAAAEAVFSAGFAPYGASAVGPKPPLPTPIVPSRLRVQTYGDVAVLTFEVARATELARRTLVARREGGVWRIVHIHASSADVQP